MSVVLADFARYVRGDDGFTADDQPFAEKALEASERLILRYLSGGEPPEAVMDTARLELAKELYQRSKSIGGVRQIGEDQSTRMARDPMTAVYPMLAPWAQNAGPLVG